MAYQKIIAERTRLKLKIGNLWISPTIQKFRDDKAILELLIEILNLWFSIWEPENKIPIVCLSVQINQSERSSRGGHLFTLEVAAN